MKTVFKIFTLLFMMIMSMIACKNAKQIAPAATDDFSYFVEQFEDLRILKYKLPGFEALSLQQKEYVLPEPGNSCWQGYFMGSELQV
jgi:dipeptidyl-peptidase-3